MTRYFAVETTSRAGDCEIMQLAVVTQQESFSEYIVPAGNISPSATVVQGISICYDAGEKRGLSKNGVAINCREKLAVFRSFLEFLVSIRASHTGVDPGFHMSDLPQLN